MWRTRLQGQYQRVRVIALGEAMCYSASWQAKKREAMCEGLGEKRWGEARFTIIMSYPFSRKNYFIYNVFI